jgi:hypothetical protein
LRAHLLDPAISTSGRANLLAVVFVATPLALQENLDNIERMMAAIKDRVDRGLPDSLRIRTDLETKVAARKERLRTESRPADADRRYRWPRRCWMERCSASSRGQANAGRLCNF